MKLSERRLGQPVGWKQVTVAALRFLWRNTANIALFDYHDEMVDGKVMDPGFPEQQC